jgi:5-methylcytosine-specific restriction protein A
MPSRSKRPCASPGCPNLVTSGYCEKHKRNDYEYRRGSASQRGYNSRWAKYSKWFLKQPGNHLCVLRLDDKCGYASECVDHIQPPNGPDDELFWLTSNHQPACIHCNSVKGHRTMKGEG